MKRSAFHSRPQTRAQNDSVRPPLCARARKFARREAWISRHRVHDLERKARGARGKSKTVRCGLRRAAHKIGAAKRYIEAFEKITGTTFVPDTEPPLARIARNLGMETA